ncbi:hypothetical protein EVAR_82567_1 [Eumeta japonica]|uniref:Uncharacterized protein n=1 Tax=Eumeta variegata TaxID=151549 RepID=A0A4C1UWK6_EUMVA|nr:hypothetical protein EVAR_82567_1 [Eumeta japonica]
MNWADRASNTHLNGTVRVVKSVAFEQIVHLVRLPTTRELANVFSTLTTGSMLRRAHSVVGRWQHPPRPRARGREDFVHLTHTDAYVYPNLLVGRSFVNVYHEPLMTGMSGLRSRRRASLAQIVSQINATTSGLVKSLINSGKG